MMGDVNGDHGVIPRAIRHIFQYAADHSDRLFLIRVSYMEIYNEEIYDLLAPPSADKKKVLYAFFGADWPGDGRFVSIFV